MKALVLMTIATLMLIGCGGLPEEELPAPSDDTVAADPELGIFQDAAVRAAAVLELLEGRSFVEAKAELEPMQLSDLRPAPLKRPGNILEPACPTVSASCIWWAAGNCEVCKVSACEGGTPYLPGWVVNCY